MAIFDRTLLRRRRNRAASRFGAHDFLVREAASLLADRLEDVQRSFPSALALGSHQGQIATAIRGKGGIKHLVMTDVSETMLRGARGERVVCDEEWLPFAPQSFDLALCTLTLHTVNDLPGTLAQLHHVLKPDGLLLAVLFGAETLRELREVLAEAETTVRGGVSPRIAPFITVQDGGALLQRAGFQLPVTDSEPLRVDYPDMPALLRELRGMGEANILRERQRTMLRRDVLAAASALYRERFGEADGVIPATFEFITLTGWKN